MGDRGSQRVRLVDVAARAGVTASLVSQVLRDGGSTTTRVAPATAQRVRSVAKQLGYQPNLLARQLKAQCSDVVGVLIGAETTPANMRRLAAVEQAARARQWRLMIGAFHADAAGTREYLLDYLQRGIQTLVCFHNPAPAFDGKLLPLLMQFRAAVFQTNAPYDDACVVDVDRVQGVCDACAHLLSRGRRRIGLILNENPDHDRLMADRLAGWQAGLRAAAIEPDARLVWWGSGAFPPTPQLVSQAATHLLRSRCDAVIASNDVWALRLMRELRRSGRRVPDDIAVVGFDNLDAAELCDPALTSIDQNNAAFGEAAVALLTSVLEDAHQPVTNRKTVVPAKLVVREST